MKTWNESPLTYEWRGRFGSEEESGSFELPYVLEPGDQVQILRSGSICAHTVRRVVLNTLADQVELEIG